jgi:hypothetical protein
VVPSESPPRFRDDLSTIYDFMDEILVRCPRCGALATVAAFPRRPVLSPFQSRRLTCLSCGHIRDKDSGVYSVPDADAPAMFDPYFALPLWLQASTEHGLLWAYNLDHLALIRRFVAAGSGGGARTEAGLRVSLVSRLPCWTAEAGNRAEVLRVIARLAASVSFPGPAS